jgi:hypothetical protein
MKLAFSFLPTAEFSILHCRLRMVSCGGASKRLCCHRSVLLLPLFADPGRTTVAGVLEIAQASSSMPFTNMVQVLGDAFKVDLVSRIVARLRRLPCSNTNTRLAHEMDCLPFHPTLSFPTPAGPRTAALIGDTLHEAPLLWQCPTTPLRCMR